MDRTGQKPPTFGQFASVTILATLLGISVISLFSPRWLLLLL